MKNKKQILTPKCGTKNISWLFWQRKAQTHIAINILYKPEKWRGIWSNEAEILEDGIYVWTQALRYKDRGYHKFHRKCRKDAKTLLKKLR